MSTELRANPEAGTAPLFI